MSEPPAVRNLEFISHLDTDAYIEINEASERLIVIRYTGKDTVERQLVLSHECASVVGEFLAEGLAQFDRRATHLLGMVLVESTFKARSES